MSKQKKYRQNNISNQSETLFRENYKRELKQIKTSPAFQRQLQDILLTEQIKPVYQRKKAPLSWGRLSLAAGGAVLVLGLAIAAPVLIQYQKLFIGTGAANDNALMPEALQTTSEGMDTTKSSANESLEAIEEIMEEAASDLNHPEPSLHAFSEQPAVNQPDEAENNTSSDEKTKNIETYAFSEDNESSAGSENQTYNLSDGQQTETEDADTGRNSSPPLMMAAGAPSMPDDYLYEEDNPAVLDFSYETDETGVLWTDIEQTLPVSSLWSNDYDTGKISSRLQALPEALPVYQYAAAPDYEAAAAAEALQWTVTSQWENQIIAEEGSIICTPQYPSGTALLVTLAEPIALAENSTSSENASTSAQKAAYTVLAEEIFDEYGKLTDIEKPAYGIFSTYSSTGIPEWKINIYEDQNASIAAAAVSQMYIYLSVNEAEEIVCDSFSISKACYYDTVGIYPTITLEEAKSTLLEGNCWTSISVEQLNGKRLQEDDISSVSLSYLRAQDTGCIFPAYQFYVKIRRDETGQSQNINSCGLFIVPALSEEVLSNFPVNIYQG